MSRKPLPLILKQSCEACCIYFSGYKSCKKLFLHIEEAVYVLLTRPLTMQSPDEFLHLHRYLVSKGSLLLTLFDADGQQQLLSLQEATELMVRLLT